MSVRNRSRHLALVATALAFAPAAGVAAQPLDAQPAAQAAATVYKIPSIEPRVPVAAGKPCTVTLLQHRRWPQEGVYRVVDPGIVYTPPPACPPPWSKVILKVDLQSSQRSILDSLGMDLARVRLFRSAVPRYDGLTGWHLERDLTDYSALFKVPHTGRIWSAQGDGSDFGWDHLDTIYYGSAQLLFYPATPATPAPRVPDAVIAVNQDTPANLPHNIVRAYLDVENSFMVPNPVWFTCWSDDTTVPLADYFAPGVDAEVAIHRPVQGCGGGSFSELQVKVDGTLAGIAPSFPLLIADMNWYFFNNTVDQPITPPEMRNAKPYRVDLSPFAAILSDAGPHSVTGGGTLLLYLDRHRTQVTGAVTLNTLATENGAPTDTNTLAQKGNSVRGEIKTRQHRDFTIRGFVNTSSGRIDSSVHQTSDFSNTQAFHLEGPQPLGDCDSQENLYVQDLWLDSSTVQTSRRSRGNQLISWDQVSTQYPLQLNWHVASTIGFCDAFEVAFHRTNITALQRRVIDGDHYRPGLGFFRSHAGARFYSSRKGGDQQTDPRWQSYTTRNYTDNFGSCYHAEMASWNGAITSRSVGGTCPGGRNNVRWFAHPDGSPDTLGWWH
jgi:hypothetical protein